MLKVVRDGGDDGRWPARADASDPYYWRREPLAYLSGAIDAFGVPDVRACVERPDGSVAIWLDDGGEPSSLRTPDELAVIARRLGAAQAGPVLDEPWLVRGFLAEYLRLHGLDDDCARLDELPHTLCHNDFHPGNVLADGSIIDWAYCGIGPVGLDAGVLVVDAIADEVVSSDLAEELTDAVWAGYTAGFGRDDDAVRRGFVEGARRLRWLPRGQKPAWDATLALIERLASAG